MKKRVVLVTASVGIAATVVALAAGRGTAQDPAGAFQVQVVEDTAGLPGPTQPIFYRHDIHVGQYEMDCRYCHFAVEVSSSPGIPTISTCMGCHIIAGAGNPEVEKLKTAANEQRPIEWVEVHKVARFVKFPHNLHVNSDLGPFADKEVPETCVECHGPIAEMPQVYRFATLKMGWCLDCHEESEASTDCTVCHY